MNSRFNPNRKFQASGVKLSGPFYTYLSPPHYDVAVFIHGDGPHDRTSNGHYAFIMNALLKNNIACFSFDKAGVGDSKKKIITHIKRFSMIWARLMKW